MSNTNTDIGKIPFRDEEIGMLSILLNMHTDTITDAILGNVDTELSRQIREIVKATNEISAENYLSQFLKNKRENSYGK